MDGFDLTENYETGLFESKDRLLLFVRCEFIPDEPVWINVSGQCWEAVYAGNQHHLDWSQFDLTKALTTSLQNVILSRLKNNSPSYLSHVHQALTGLFEGALLNGVDFQSDFTSVNASQWLSIWSCMNSYSRSLIRSIYQEMAEKKLAGADFSIAKEMGRWKAKHNTQTLRLVMEWDVDSGSFTSSEWEIIRGFLNVRPPDESEANFATRIFGRILNETLKRPQQILSMKRNALWIAPSGREYFLRIPKAKGQAGQRPTSWQITESLALEIQQYSAGPQIYALQELYDRLIVMPPIQSDGLGTLNWMAYGQVDVLTAKIRLQNLARQNQIISPRTDSNINLTPYRIRHTGATAMALQGVPREQIQEVLEHDSPGSADAYIHAVGADLMPALEKATDRGVGKIFSELSDSYFFKGTIIDKVVHRPIHIPIAHEDISPPAVVGACGKDGACTKHPFWACYNGCPHFLAWRDAFHHKSLEYVESELKRWSDAEGGKQRSKLGKDFDRVGAAISEVISQIERFQGGELLQ